MKLKTRLLVALPAVLAAATVFAHHNPIAYDGKKEVKITGTVTSAYFGDPHSRYKIDVTNKDGVVEEWLLMTEDPRDARALGFADAIKSIKIEDAITVVGWPHRSKDREIRGHQLHYPDGTIVMMRTGNYIWTRDMRVIYQIVSGELELDEDVIATDPALSDADRVIAWIDEEKILQRVALETMNRTAQLVGFRNGDNIEFPGVGELFQCHTSREGFTMVLEPDRLSAEQEEILETNSNFVSRYNATLSRYWEQDVESC
jgi:hypothetical protein